MSADVIMFRPRSNPNADRAFWKGPDPDLVGMTNTLDHIAETVIAGALADNFIIPRAFSDSAPAEYNYQAPTDDPA